MGRAANQNINDSSEFTLTGSHLIDLDRQGNRPIIANRVSDAAKRTVPTGSEGSGDDRPRPATDSFKRAGSPIMLH
jgi:hypothetical protein